MILFYCYYSLCNNKMGILNCRYECHYYLKDETSLTKKLKKGEVNKNRPIIQINPNFPKKLNNFPYIFDISKYSDLLDEKIVSYIKNNKLNYKSYSCYISNEFNPNPNQFPNGNIFIGKINSNNEIEGYGIYIFKDKKIIIEGIWEKGDIVFGRIFFPEDDIYEGELSHLMPHGKGQFLLSNGDIYKGDFVLSEMTGKGTYIFSDKTYYCGDFTNGAFNGEGSMKWTNGDEYHGIFSDSCLNGKGKIFNDLISEKYIGNFENNEFNGDGIYKYQNEDKYEGNFENGIRKGKGTYTLQNGTEFQGTWDKDLPNGEGVIFYKKMKIKGIWKDGKKVRILEILERNKNIKNIENINLDIKTCKRKIIPSSLPHLSINEKTEISQYVLMTENHFI